MYILFDIGATKMRVAVSRNGESFDQRRVRIVATPRTFAKGIAMLKKLAPELAQGKKIKAAVGGIAGSLDAKRETIFRAPNVPNWSKKPLKKALQKAFGTKNIFLENDTALVGLGEAVRGAGKGKPIVAYITVSTGVNGARIINGKIDKSACGFEIGRQFIGADSANNVRHTLEYFIGAAALKKRYGMPAEKIKSQAIWDKINRHLAIGVYNTILHWSPHVVVLGGGMIRSGSISVKNVEKMVREILTIFPVSPPLRKAALGDSGGLHGALIFLSQQQKKDPQVN